MKFPPFLLTLLWQRNSRELSDGSHKEKKKKRLGDHFTIGRSLSVKLPSETEEFFSHKWRFIGKLKLI